MKLSVLLFLISLPVYSNTFQLLETGARFSLKISATEVVYHSEALDKKIMLKSCNRSLAKDLNAEIISLIPTKPNSQGLKFLVDDKEILISKEDKLSSRLLAMDSRLIRFIVEEKVACK